MQKEGNAGVLFCGGFACLVDRIVNKDKKKNSLNELDSVDRSVNKGEKKSSVNEFNSENNGEKRSENKYPQQIKKIEYKYSVELVIIALISCFLNSVSGLMDKILMKDSRRRILPIS